jgi:uncharacterized repeat protein (TIGR01451 family)
LACLLLAMTIFMPALLEAATITSLRANKDVVGRYERYELTFNLTNVSPPNYNPFRPETTGDSLSAPGVDVRAEVITPNGETQIVWGFWDVDYVYLGNSKRYPGRDLLIPASAPHWHIRYSPMSVGVYRITVKVTDQSGTTSSPQMTFTCVESGKKGFITKSDDGTRLAFSDGTPFIPFGTMMPYGAEKFEPSLAAMKANGINFVRRWLVNRERDDIFRNFEGWSPYTSDSTVYRSGTCSAKKTVSGPGTVVDQSFIPCKPNTYYKAIAYLKTSSSFNGTVAVNVNEDGADGSTISHTGNEVGGNRDWTLSEVVFRTGSTAEMLHFKPKIISGSTGTIWIDDVGLYECDSSGNITVDYNMVFIPGFEPWTPAQLRMKALARFEVLLQRCEELGIYVQAAIFDYLLWNRSNPTGFYAEYFGDFFSDPASTAQQDRVLRYLVARFGSYSSLFAWELTNEMDSAYADVRGNWIIARANKIKQGDVHKHLITNSLWNSPGDYKYAQLEVLDLNQVHHYLITEEWSTGQGYPAWGTITSGMTIDTNPSNAASGSKSLKATANGSVIAEEAVIYCKPNRSYTIRYKIKTSGVTGKASMVVRFNGGDSPGTGFSIDDSGTIGYTARSRTFNTGSTAVNFVVSPQLTGSSGTAWWDDVEVIDNVTGNNLLYNGGFECPPLGDDEYDWARFHTMNDIQCYTCGPNGTDKPWASGEFGLMGDRYDLSYWARRDDNTKPRHDSTGIHLHNCLWAQFMASSALNTPVYWWVTEYVIAWDLFSAWKGITTFAANLPFYDQGTTVASDPCAEIRATSSDSRIRILGQKKANSGYFWIQNSQNTWSRVVREGVNPTPVSATLTVPGFEEGVYTLSWYDTYTGLLTREESQTVTDGTLSMSVASLATDTALIVVKSREGAGHPFVDVTLVADKTTAVPSDIITYTLTYTNNGSGEAVNVEVKLPIPTNTTYVPGSASPGGTYDSSANCIKWTIPNLAPGASGVFSAKVRVN